ncbi:MAG: hypothetical protein KatS3mg057_0102 [Herpetosiphonaceae bacterium]|nr:MAG: hypothetical protein KatS3mg057_0102 [Herpetosiphonaceae bacterium]
MQAETWNANYKQQDRKLQRRTSLNWLMLLSIGAAFAFLALGASFGAVETFDRAILTWVHQQRTLLLDHLMAAATWIGAEIGMTLQALLFLGVLLWRRPAGWGWYAGLLLLALPIGYLINIELKQIYNRPRPTLYPSEYLAAEDDASFPSGHAWAATCYYGTIAYLLLRQVRRASRQALILLGAALCIGTISISRIYLAVHYPTDSIAGMIGGLGWLGLSMMCISAATRLSSKALWSTIWRR